MKTGTYAPTPREWVILNSFQRFAIAKLRRAGHCTARPNGNWIYCEGIIQNAKHGTYVGEVSIMTVDGVDKFITQQAKLST